MRLLCRLFGHKYGDWVYAAEDSCEQIRTCKRGGYKESRILHQNGEWKYVSEDSCEQVRTCRRDGHEERRAMPHQFGKWEYSASDSCEQARFCLRCRIKEANIVHNWGSWENKDGNSHAMTCGRCGKTVEEEHAWEREDHSETVCQGGTEWEVYRNTTVRCPNCNDWGSYVDPSKEGAKDVGIC